MKMRLLKKAIPVLAALFLVSIPATVCANDVLRASDKTFVQGSVFTDAELAELNELAAKYEETAGASLYVVAKDAGAQEETSAAKAELQSIIENGGGYGDKHRGVILFINTNEENRSFAIVERADDGSEKLKNTDSLTEEGSKLYKLLQDKKYAEGAKQFLNTVNSKLKPNFFKSIWMKLIAALGVGGAASGLAVGSHKAQAATKKRHYLKDGNISILKKNERLEDTKVTRTAAPESKKTDQKLDEKSHGSGNKL